MPGADNVSDFTVPLEASGVMTLTYEDTDVSDFTNTEDGQIIIIQPGVGFGEGGFGEGGFGGSGAVVIGFGPTLWTNITSP